MQQECSHQKRNQAITRTCLRQRRIWTRFLGVICHYALGVYRPLNRTGLIRIPSLSYPTFFYLSPLVPDMNPGVHFVGFCQMCKTKGQKTNTLGRREEWGPHPEGPATLSAARQKSFLHFAKQDKALQCGTAIHAWCGHNIKNQQVQNTMVPRHNRNSCSVWPGLETIWPGDLVSFCVCFTVEP